MRYATDYGEAGPRVRVNFADGLTLTTVHGIGPRSAERILLLRESVGNLNAKTLKKYLKVPVTGTMLASLDFAENPELYLTEDELSSHDSDSPAHAEMTQTPSRESTLRAAALDIRDSLMRIQPFVPVAEPLQPAPTQWTPTSRPAVSVERSPSHTQTSVTREPMTTVQQDYIPDYQPPVYRLAEAYEGPSLPPPKSRATRSVPREYEAPREPRSTPRVPRQKYDTKRIVAEFGEPTDQRRSQPPAASPRRRASAVKRPSPTRRRQINRGGADSDSESDDGARTRRRRKRPPTIPKNLSYDGKGNFSAFRQKFDTYADAYDWSAGECKSCLCWSLTGKASDFYATITEMDEGMTFNHIMTRLEKRFGEKDLDETAQVRFHQAMQKEGEKLDDWADRVTKLANLALWDLPERHVTRQAVLRFCQGLRDTDAARDVCIRRPRDMEEAIDHVKLFSNVDEMMQERKTARKGTATPPEPEVYETSHKRRQSPQKDDTSDRLAALAAEVGKLAREVQQTRPAAPQNPWTNPRPPIGPGQLRFPPPAVHPAQRQMRDQAPAPDQETGCFYCGADGHIKRECPYLQCYGCGELGHLKMFCPKRLNENGSRRRANPRSQQ